MKKLILYTLSIPDSYWLNRSFDTECENVGAKYNRIFFSTEKDAFEFAKKVLLNAEEDRYPLFSFPSSYLIECGKESKYMFDSSKNEYVTYGEPSVKLEGLRVAKYINVSARMYFQVKDKEKITHNGFEYYRDIDKKIFTPWCDVGPCQVGFIDILKKEYFIFENMVN